MIQFISELYSDARDGKRVVEVARRLRGNQWKDWVKGHLLYFLYFLSLFQSLHLSLSLFET